MILHFIYESNQFQRGGEKNRFLFSLAVHPNKLLVATGQCAGHERHDALVSECVCGRRAWTMDTNLMALFILFLFIFTFPCNRKTSFSPFHAIEKRRGAAAHSRLEFGVIGHSCYHW